MILLSMYPPKPIKPDESDCCGSGCSTCVFDLYELDLKKWERRCNEENKNVTNSELETALNIYDYTKFKVTHVQQDSSTISVFTFECPEKQTFQIRCGQHLVCRCVDNNGKYVIRPYTPILNPENRSSFIVAINCYSNGKMSSCIKSWTLGTLVDFRGPFGNFLYKPNSYSTILMLAGGTGITAILQVLQSIVLNEDDFTRVFVIYSVQSEDDIIYSETLNEWESFWNINISYCITRNTKDSVKLKYGIKYYLRRIDGDILLSIINKNLAKFQTLICGSQNFKNDMYKLVKNLYDVSDDMIYCFC